MPIEEEPEEKMPEMPSTVNPEFVHLFQTPIYAVFAILPYPSREVMASETSRYAEQFFMANRRAKICGYQ
jgi:hypothetical protein